MPKIGTYLLAYNDNDTFVLWGNIYMDWGGIGEGVFTLKNSKH